MSASGSTINIKTEIVRLVENQGEKAELLSYFTKHKDQQDDALSDLNCFDTDKSKLTYLRTFLKP
ncbi:9579_t:CDS:1, partial [Rhizophagus irregularis]